MLGPGRPRQRTDLSWACCAQCSLCLSRWKKFETTSYSNAGRGEAGLFHNFNKIPIKLRKKIFSGLNWRVKDGTDLPCKGQAFIILDLIDLLLLVRERSQTVPDPIHEGYHQSHLGLRPQAKTIDLAAYLGRLLCRNYPTYQRFNWIPCLNTGTTLIYFSMRKKFIEFLAGEVRAFLYLYIFMDDIHAT